MTLIAAVGNRGEIGRDGDLVWRIPADLRHFKELTLGQAVIMGRKTWESLPHRPLPGRLNIVLTRNGEYECDGALKASDLDEAVRLAAGRIPFVIGGESVYRQALPLAQRIELTRIHATDGKADAFFPPVNPEEWEMTEAHTAARTDDGLVYEFMSLKRKA